MKKYIYILFLIVFTSCNFINPFHDEGKNIETVIELDDFTQIEIHNIFNIEIVEDSESYILYKGGERILDEMTYSSLSGILKLDHSFMNWTKNLKIPTLEIHMPLLEGEVSEYMHHYCTFFVELTDFIDESKCLRNTFN